MLWIDLIDIIYLLIGVIIGATFVAGLASRICDDCERRNNGFGKEIQDIAN